MAHIGVLIVYPFQPILLATVIIDAGCMKTYKASTRDNAISGRDLLNKKAPNMFAVDWGINQWEVGGIVW